MPDYSNIEEQEYEILEIGDYRYKIYEVLTGWCGVEVIDKTKSSYENMLSTIVYTDPSNSAQYTLRVTYLKGCFEECENLVVSPSLSTNAESLSRCFEDCLSLTTAPTIPNSVTSMFRCFENCRKLTTPPNIPASVTSMDMCFEDCRALTTAPAIPASVNSLVSCFENCKSMATPPNMANATSVRDMDSCFQGCESMTTAPIIPASVTGLSDSFRYCTSLAGNVVVNGVPSYGAGDMFLGTSNNIYIINGAGTTAVRTAWTNIARGYSNVHYEANDNPTPALSMSVTRVDTAVSETPSPTGEYAFIKATAILYDTYIPDGWSVEYEGEGILKDGVMESPYWTRTNVGNTYTLKCWFSLGDTTKHTFTLQVADIIKDANDNTKIHQDSPLVIQTLPKAYKLVDYYHDPTTQTEGMSIGKFATEANLFDVDMPALFRDTVSIEDNNNVARQLFDFIYPVGSYYETSDTTFDPNVRWGGTWVRETAGLVHVSASIGTGTDYEVIGAPSDTQDGGEKTHELTAGETGIRNHVHAMGAHTHNSTSGYYLLFLSTSGNKAVNRRSIKPGSGTAISNIYYGENAIERGSVIGGMTSATNTGNPTVGEQSGSAHNNMQPYINVVRWHRTA